MASVSSKEDNMGLLDARVGVMEKRFDKMEVSISALTDAFNNRQRTNWGLVLSLYGAVAAMLTGGWYLIDLKTSNTVATHVNPIAAKADISEKERESHGKAISELAHRQTSSEGMITELETQHRANSQIRNAFLDHMQADIAELYEEVKKRPMPRWTYYPDISLPKPAK